MSDEVHRAAATHSVTCPEETYTFLRPFVEGDACPRIDKVRRSRTTNVVGGL